jgi:hypothetical protein
MGWLAASTVVTLGSAGQVLESLPMATREQVRRFQTAQPFRPFLVRLADGRQFEVRHPELISCDVRGREMFLSDDEGTHYIEMLLVAEMISAPSGVVAPQDNGG